VLCSNLNVRQATPQEVLKVTTICIDTRFQSLSPLINRINHHAVLKCSNWWTGVSHSAEARLCHEHDVLVHCLAGRQTRPQQCCASLAAALLSATSLDSTVQVTVKAKFHYAVQLASRSQTSSQPNSITLSSLRPARVVEQDSVMEYGLNRSDQVRAVSTCRDSSNLSATGRKPCLRPGLRPG